jgi:CxxC motif-containing protein
MKNIVTCTVCPNGCEIEVNYTTKEDAVLTGYACKRGITYALDECFEPKRTFTASVKISGSDRRVLPVRTTAPIPKALLMQAAEALEAISLEVPVKCGEVIVDNFLDTDVKLVSAMTLEGENA